MNYKELRRRLVAAQASGGVNAELVALGEALRTRQLRPEDFSLRSLAEHTIDDGLEYVASLNPRKGGVPSAIVEANDVVHSALFTAITGQIIYTRVMAEFESPALIGTTLVETIPTEFDGEKIPGIGAIGDQAQTVDEGKPYPYAGVGPDYIETPRTTKRGLIVAVTREAVFFDRTGLVLRRAGEVGQTLAVNKEKRILDGVLGISTLYRRNGAAPAATYGDSPFDNLAASNPLIDWSSVQACDTLLAALTDPNTGEPINTVPNTAIVPVALQGRARIVFGASSVGAVTPGYATSANPNVTTVGGNNLRTGVTVVSSPYVKLRTSSDSTWFYGDPRKAFAYMENWPITVVQAPADSAASFERDIVAQFRASERGAVAVMEPRHMVKSTG